MNTIQEIPVGRSWGPISFREEVARPVRKAGMRRRLTSVTLVAWMVRLSALINLIGFAVPHEPQFFHWLSAWAPFEISAGRRVLMLLTAVLLFILSSGLDRGKRSAWLLTVAALMFTPFIHLGRADIWPQVLLNLPLIALLFLERRYFVALSDRTALRSALIICPVLFAALVIFGTVRLYDLREETSGPDSWLGCLQAACELELVQNAQTQQAQTHQAYALFSELRMGGTLIALLALYLAMRPVLARPEARPGEQERVARLIARHGRDPMNSYALLADKSYFFTDAGDAAIPYVVSGRLAVALADPIGTPEGQVRAVREFYEHCRQHDWVPVFYEIADDLLDVYDQSGFAALKIGEDARLSTEAFELRGRDFQNLRTLANKARKENIHFRWYDASRGVDDVLELQLAEISRCWLKGKKRMEMTFDMGSFSPAELRHGVGVGFNAEGRPLAFVTWRSFRQGRGMVLDLMRSLPEARNVLDFLLLESIAHFREQGIFDVSLGNAPLADAQGHEPASVESRMVRFIYENLNQVYAYKPLFEFKRKYRPRWRARYLAYPAGESLPLIGLALVRVHTCKGPLKFLTG